MHHTVTHPVCFDSSIVGARWLVCFWKNIPDRQPDLGCIANAAKMALTDDTCTDHSLPGLRSVAKPLKSTSPRFEVMTLTSADNTWRGLYDCFPCRRGWEVRFLSSQLSTPVAAPWAKGLDGCAKGWTNHISIPATSTPSIIRRRMEEPVIPRCRVSDVMRSSPAQASTLNTKST